MSETPSTAADLIPRTSFREDLDVFLRCAVECVAKNTRQEGDRLIITLTADQRAAFGDAEEVDADLTPGSSFHEWLLGQLASETIPLHARPSKQPLTVNDLVSPLFAAYEVEGGQVHLGGCQLTDHPFFRLTFAEDDKTVCHVFVAPDGSTVEDSLVRELGLDEITSFGERHPRIDDAAISALRGAGQRIASKAASSRNPDATVGQPLAATIVWIRHADGQLQFTIGESTATQAFSSWARLLKPQPFVARFSGASGFNLAATDDGRIDLADQIEACEHSGRRVLRQDLIECSVTSQKVLPEFTEVCAVVGLPALKSEFVTCGMCLQRVSKAALVDQTASELRCRACLSLKKVGKDDPRLVWIFGEHPGLDRWGRWQMAETEAVYIAQGATLTKRLLVVVDKETLGVRRLATSGLLSPGWVDVSEATQSDLLK
ncbi:MAG: hypothetical protein RH917_19455 [Lacipirellulaceae bacterium]